MPIYSFRCPCGADFDAKVPVGTQATPCLACGEPAAKEFVLMTNFLVPKEFSSCTGWDLLPERSRKSYPAGTGEHNKLGLRKKGL